MIDEAKLLDSVREDDHVAFAKLLDKYTGLVINLVGSFKREGMTREDLEDMSQEARMLLYKAARTYNADSGLTFGLYAGTCIRNGLISLARKRSREVERVSAELSEFEISVPDTTDYIDEFESANALMEKIKDVLSARELAVFKYLTLDYKHAEIATKLGITNKSVENAVFRIKKKLGTLLF